jgi:hypothetical protein
VASHQAYETFYKAQSLAYWSYIGILIPLVGVILGSLSKSRLRLLHGGSDEEVNELERIWRIASWGFGISLTLFILQIIAAITWGVIVGLAMGNTSRGY